MLIWTVQPDAAGNRFLSLPGGSRQSGLLLGCSKERQPPPAIHYLECVSAADTEWREFRCMIGRTAEPSVWKGKLSQETVN